MRYCIFRSDRIGDLILTLPMAEAIKRSDPSAHVTYCVQEYTRSLLSLASGIDDVITIRGRDLDGRLRRFADVLRGHEFDCAVFAYPRPRLAIAAALAGIPQRIGSRYRWYAPLFTHRRHEHRRDGQAHEMDFNLGLLEEIGIATPADLQPVLNVGDAEREAGRAVLRRMNIDSCTNDNAGFPCIMLHPGSGKSAKDWPVEYFAALARRLREEFPELHLLVTGTRDELPLMEAVSGDDAHIHILREPVSLDVLAGLLSWARLFIANSTGPLHIAAACRVPVLAFYPFGRAVNARRWGPRTAHATVLSPEADPSCSACLRRSCKIHDDMRRISVSDAFEAAHHLVPDVFSRKGRF
ncbi:MAG: glycosyltransferase family 9 protein [Bacteroidetes bacterium]|nr:glycosyltransferase family 9 protein [Bacteroidota bacterium]